MDTENGHLIEDADGVSVAVRDGDVDVPVWHRKQQP
jgi:hypothetical protein